MSTMVDEIDEGWGIIVPPDRKSHYYRNSMSLCGRRGFYLHELTPDDYRGPDDCAACRKKLDKEPK